MRTLIENEFKKQLEQQLLNEGKLYSNGKNIPIIELGTIEGITLQDKLNTADLVSNNGTNVCFLGSIRFTPEETGISNVHRFKSDNVAVHYESETRQFVFKSKISISLLDL